MRGLLAPDPSVLRLSGKFPANPVYAPADPAHAARPVRNHDWVTTRPPITGISTHDLPSA